MNRDLLGQSGIIMNFNDRLVTWDNDFIPIKDRGISTLSSAEFLIEAYLNANEPQTNHKQKEMNILGLPKFLKLIIRQQA
jgi:hypothetical protein